MLMFTFVVQICLFSSVRQDTLSPKFANISCKTGAACHPGWGGGVGDLDWFFPVV
jgi:hypothetical protein